MYKLTPLYEGKLFSIIRIADNTFIPVDQANADYQAYLDWVAEGNTPEPAEDK